MDTFNKGKYSLTKFVGWFFFILGIIFLYMGDELGQTYDVMGFCFLGLGALMIWSMNKTRKNFMKKHIYENSTIIISDMVYLFKSNPREVVSMISDLQTKGSIVGYFDSDKKIFQKYDNSMNSIRKDNNIVDNFSANKTQNNLREPKLIRVKCKECGAINDVMSGEIKECEYCGTVLEAKAENKQ